MNVCYILGMFYLILFIVYKIFEKQNIFENLEGIYVKVKNELFFFKMLLLYLFIVLLFLYIDINYEIHCKYYTYIRYFYTYFFLG